MSDDSSLPLAAATGPQAGHRLDSWKEIAVYLNREVRTVQRWEKNEGLPVHRHLHDKLGSVYAYKFEVDAWWKERQQGLAQEVVDSEGIEPEPEQAPECLSIPKSAEVSVPRPASGPLAVAGLVVLTGALALGAGYLIRHGGSTGAHPPAGKVKLVVLPFRNLSGDPAQDSFADGLTDEMTTQLAKLEPDRLGVIASNTAMTYKGSSKSLDEIALELRVDYLLEGSVRHAGERVRIGAQLIQATDQTHIWAEDYDRDLRDILALQSDVSQAIASQIQLTLSAQVKERLARLQPVNRDAYEAYLQGLAYWIKRNPEALAQSADFFRRATQIDPNYALAYAGLASAYTLMSQAPNDVSAPRDIIPKAKAAAAKALELDRSSAQAHAVMALVRQSYDWDWAGAESEYKQAFDLNGGYATARQWHSLLLMAMGRHREAVDEIERARELDPLSTVIRSSHVQAHYFSRDYDEVISECEQMLAVEPSFLILHYHLGQTYAQTGRLPEAIAEFQTSRKQSGESPVIVMALGHAYGVAGDKSKALDSLRKLDEIARHRYVPAHYYAAIYTGLGDKDKAFEWLDKAYQERSEYLIFLNVEPMADPLRSDPRFQSLLRRIGLPP